MLKSPTFDLYRCYLPTGQIRWLCKNHQKGNRITVLSNDVDVGVRFGDAELVTEDDRLIAAHIDKMSDLAQPYRNRRSKKPRKMALTVSGLEDGKNIFFLAFFKSLIIKDVCLTLLSALVLI